MPIRKNENVCGFEIHFGFIVRYEFGSQEHLPSLGFLTKIASNSIPVFVAAVGSTRNHQAIIVTPSQHLTERCGKILKALLRRDPPIEQYGSILGPDPQPSLCFFARQSRHRNRIVDPERNRGDARLPSAKVFYQLTLRLVGVNENVVSKAILYSQGESVQQ